MSGCPSGHPHYVAIGNVYDLLRPVGALIHGFAEDRVVAMEREFGRALILFQKVVEDNGRSIGVAR